MKIITRLFLLIAFVSVTACETLTPAESQSYACKTINELIGSALLTKAIDSSYVPSSRGYFGGDRIFSESIEAYKECKEFYTNQGKLNYFWTLYWSFDFQNASLHYFVDEIDDEILVGFRDLLLVSLAEHESREAAGGLAKGKIRYISDTISIINIEYLSSQ